jgi:hypothetical protein
MKIGTLIRIRDGPWKGWAAYVIDDCFRATNERCTMLVKLKANLEIELEINVEDVNSYG